MIVVHKDAGERRDGKNKVTGPQKAQKIKYIIKSQVEAKEEKNTKR